MPVCTHRVAGAIIAGSPDHSLAGPPGHYLLSQRKKAPWGITPPACGHVDEGDGWDEDAYYRALVRETREESGLEVAERWVLAEPHWRHTACRRPPLHPQLIGHTWSVYVVLTHGTPTAKPDETSNLAWYSPDQIGALVQRTVDYAHGRISDCEFEAEPGIEPVWVYYFAIAQIVPEVAEEDLGAIEELAAHLPELAC